MAASDAPPVPPVVPGGPAFEADGRTVAFGDPRNRFFGHYRRLRDDTERFELLGDNWPNVSLEWREGIKLTEVKDRRRRPVDPVGKLRRGRG